MEMRFIKREDRGSRRVPNKAQILCLKITEALVEFSRCLKEETW